MAGTDGTAVTVLGLGAMGQALAEMADVIDTGDYAREGLQSLEFSDLGDLLQASRDQGVSPELVAPIQALIERQLAAGHGKDTFERIYEAIRSRAA